MGRRTRSGDIAAVVYTMTSTRPDRVTWRDRLIGQLYRVSDFPTRLRLIRLFHRWLRQPTVRVVVSPGVVMELNPSDFVPRQILCHGGYEPASIRLFERLVRTARGAVDFGAHMGLYTLRAARALEPSGGRVVAIEPMPTHASALLHNAALSDLSNIDLWVVAASDKSALLRMDTRCISNTGGTRLADDLEPRQTRGIPLGVCVVAAADLAPLFPPECLDLVKIDVEGHEFRILRSLFAATPARPKNLLLEYLPTEFDYGAALETTGWLEAQGYELLTVTGAPFTPGMELLEGNLWARLKQG